MLRCFTLICLLLLSSCAAVNTAVMRACGASGDRVTERVVNSCVGTGTYDHRPYAFPLLTLSF